MINMASLTYQKHLYSSSLFYLSIHSFLSFDLLRSHLLYGLKLTLTFKKWPWATVSAVHDLTFQPTNHQKIKKL